MPISSQASEASEEGSETRWSNTNLLCNTSLASNTPPVKSLAEIIEGDDIVQAKMKVLEYQNR